MARKSTTDGAKTPHRRPTIIHLTPESIRELKTLGIELDRSMSDLIREAIDQFLKRRGRSTQA